MRGSGVRRVLVYLPLEHQPDSSFAEKSRAFGTSNKGIAQAREGIEKKQISLFSYDIKRIPTTRYIEEMSFNPNTAPPHINDPISSNYSSPSGGTGLRNRDVASSCDVTRARSTCLYPFLVSLFLGL